MKEVVVVGGCRTPIGNFGGFFKNIKAVDLGSIVLRETLKKLRLKPTFSNKESFLPSKLFDKGPIEIENELRSWPDNFSPINIDEVIMGNVLQAGQGQNPARQALIGAGIPKETPGFTVNKVCGSGLKAIAIAASSIMTGQANVILAGGMENMSLVPMALNKARWGHRMEITGKGEIYDLMVFDGLYEIFYGYHMGITAENIASMYDISRNEQDKLSVLSHYRAKFAISKGLFNDEIVPVNTIVRKEKILVSIDERPIDTNIEKMSNLRPVFLKDGTVTAGNASGINDGAASILLMSLDKAKELGLKVLLKIKTFKSGGLDPAYMGLGPVVAIKSALKSSNMLVNDIDMIELNEAFASQAIACMRELNIKEDFPNKLGSGISLGHPIGCTGARQFVTGMYQMNNMGYNTGLISMCIGGGMGMAMIIEK